MPRPYRARKTRQKLTEAARRWFLFGEYPDADGDEAFLPWEHGSLALWREHRDELLAEWVSKHPGSRPAAWWEFDAPPAYGTPGEIERNMRWKVGGSGEESAVVYRDRTGAYVDCDPDDPPRIESAAVYLKRLGLLLPGEAARIKPRQLRPMVLEVDPEGWAPAGAGGWTPEAA